MFSSFTFVRKAFTSVLVTGFLIALLSSSQVFAAGDCSAALSSPTGFDPVSNGGSAFATNGVVEWDDEVVRFRTNAPGVLTITSTGSGSQGALYTDGSSITLVDSAVIGATQRELKAVVGAGNHCIELEPGAGESGEFTVTAAFEDVCHNTDPDDDGDSFTCATPITVGVAASGDIDSSLADDSDMFAFELAEAADVTIESSGGEYVGGKLYDETGAAVPGASDNLNWANANFEITPASTLPAGRYYLQVTGPDESEYEVTVSASEPEAP